MFGERLQDLLRGTIPFPYVVEGTDEQRADHLVVLVHRHRHHAAQLCTDDLRHRDRRVGVVVDGDQLVAHHREPGDAERGDGHRLHPLHALVGDAATGDQAGPARVVDVQHGEAGQLDVQQLGGARGDLVEDPAQRLTPGDRPLHRAELVEEPLAALQRVDQGLVLGGLPAFHLDQVQRLQAQLEHPGHAAEEAHLLQGERRLAAEQQHARRDTAEVSQGDRVRAPVGLEGGATAGGDLGQGVRRDSLDRQADRRHRAAVDHQHGEVGIECAYGAFDGSMLGGSLIGPIGYDGEKLRQLLGGEHNVAVGCRAAQLRNCNRSASWCGRGHVPIWSRAVIVSSPVVVKVRFGAPE